MTTGDQMSHRHLRPLPTIPGPPPLLTPDEEAAADILAGEMVLEAAMRNQDAHTDALLYAAARLTIVGDREGLEGVDRILREGARHR
jgi:hypothetical protein